MSTIHATESESSMTRRTFLTVLSIAAFFLHVSPAAAGGPTTSVQGDYLMTLYVPLAEGHNVDDTLRVINHPDGWVEGPQIKGKIIPPSSDTLRNMGNGVRRIDVRLTIQMDDDQIVYVSYNGIIHCQKEVQDRFVKGEMLRTGDCYFVTAPTRHLYYQIDTAKAARADCRVQRRSRRIMSPRRPDFRRAAQKQTLMRAAARSGVVGAPRPMKMGTIASPWRYDAAT